MTIYKGTLTQPADPEIQADKGANQTPAYRGIAYHVTDNVQLEKFGNRIPNMRYEVARNANKVAFTVIKEYTSANFRFGTGTGTTNIGLHFADGVFYMCHVVAGSGATNETRHKAVDIQDNVIFDRFFNVGPALEDVLGLTNNPGRGGYCQNDGHWTNHARPGNSSPVKFEGRTFERGALLEPSTPLAYDNFIGTVRPWIRISNYAFFYHDFDSTVTDRGITYLKQGHMPEQLWLDVAGLGSSGSIVAEDGHHNADLLLFDDVTHKLWLIRTDGFADRYNIEPLIPGDKSSITYDGRWTAVPGGTGLKGAIRNNEFIFNDTSGSAKIQVLRFNEDFTTETIAIQTASDSPAIPVSLLSDHYWFIGDRLVLGNNPATLFTYNNYSSLGETLDNVVSDLCQRAGMAVTEFDVTDLAVQAVRGYVINDVKSLREQLMPLMQYYRFDCVERDYKLVFVRRGQASIVTIPQSDLRPYSGLQATEDPYTITEIEETKLPKRVEVKYVNHETNYEPDLQFHERQVTSSKHVATLDQPIGLVPLEAKQLAAGLLEEAWVSRLEYDFTLPKKYSYLDPTDVITLSLDTHSIELRLAEVNYGLNGVMECKGVAQDASLYTPDGSLETDNPIFTPPITISYISQVAAVFITDVPLRSGDSGGGGMPLYVVGAMHGGEFPGYVVQQSKDNGETWVQVGEFVDVEGTVGTVAVDAPDAFTTTEIDNVSTIDVFTGGTLTSVTEAQLIDGSNRAIVGAPGRWEVIGFQTVTDNGDGSFTLSGLLRGLNGTEENTGTHIVGDSFAILDTASVRKVELSDDSIGTTLLFRAVTANVFGEPIEVSITLSGETYHDYAPAHIVGEKRANGDYRITWARRTRQGGEWRDLVNVELAFESTPENYVLKIYTSASPRVLKRTVGGSPLLSDNEYIYTAAQQATDFGSPLPADFQVDVYQVNSVTGLGDIGNATI